MPDTDAYVPNLDGALELLADKYDRHLRRTPAGWGFANPGGYTPKAEECQDTISAAIIEEGKRLEEESDRLSKSADGIYTKRDLIDADVDQLAAYLGVGATTPRGSSS